VADTATAADEGEVELVVGDIGCPDVEVEGEEAGGAVAMTARGMVVGSTSRPPSRCDTDRRTHHITSVQSERKQQREKRR
jgi:hypothetical protein